MTIQERAGLSRGRLLAIDPKDPGADPHLSLWWSTARHMLDVDHAADEQDLP